MAVDPGVIVCWAEMRDTIEARVELLNEQAAGTTSRDTIEAHVELLNKQIADTAVEDEIVGRADKNG